MASNILKDIDEKITSQLCAEGGGMFDDFLESQGYDLNEIKNISEKRSKQFSFTLNANLNYAHDQSLLEKVSSKFSSAIERNLDRPVAFLNGLIANNQLSVRYRNLDKLNPDEIKNIIKDQNLLEILEMLEAEND